MLKGDISNALPRRFLVNIDVVRSSKPQIKKRLGIIPTVQYTHEYNMQMLSRFYIHTVKVGETLELFSVENSQEELDEMMEYLDRIGTNPFRYFTSYSSLAHVVAELPYRPELVGVVDTSERLLRYGHWGITPEEFFGGKRD